jgi:hypothetical protein
MAVYTSIRSGLTSDTNPATNPWGNAILPVVGDKVTIATGHIVTIDSVVYWGNDTATAISLLGTLEASRTASSQLTCRGDLVVAGVLDYGTEADPIPDPFVAKLIINDSATPADNKWSIRVETANNNWSGIRFWGADKLAITTLTTAALSTDTVLNVGDTTNWKIGDYLGFAPSIATIGLPTIYRAITAVTSNTVTLGASIGTSRLAGTKVMNVTRNVRLSGAIGQTWLASMVISINASYATANSIELGNFEFSVAGGGGSGNNTGGINIFFNATTTGYPNIIKKIKGVVAHSVYSVSGSTIVYAKGVISTAAGMLLFKGNLSYKPVVESFYACLHGSNSICFSGGSTVDVNALYVIASNRGITSQGTGGAIDCNVYSGYLVGGVTPVAGNGISISLQNMEIDGYGRVVSELTSFGSVTYKNCTFGALIGFTLATDMYLPSYGYLAPALIDTPIMGSGLSVSMTSVNYKNQHSANSLVIKNKNNDPQNYEKYVKGGRSFRQNAVNYRSQYAMQFDCINSAQAITETTLVPVSSGATITLKGFVRFNAAFGIVTPPTVGVSGLGITQQVFTCPAVADTWHPYTFTITNPQSYSGNITVSFSAQTASAGVSSRCWFDGLITDPWVTDARHYGFKLDQPTAVQVIDPLSVLSESAANALTGMAIDFGTNTITITESITLRQLYDWLHAQLCSTVNLSQPELLTSVDGVNFTGGYNLIIDGGAITGGGALSMPLMTLSVINGGSSSVAITHNAGVYTKISVTGLLSGSRVQIYDVTNSLELYNAIVAGASLTLNKTWTSDITVRLRVTYCVGLSAKLPVLQTAIFGASGAGFLVDQLDDQVYIGNNIDGSSVTEFTSNFSTVLVEVNDPDGVTTVQRLYNWYIYELTVANGIAGYFGAAIAEDSANYRINASLINLKIKSAQTTPIQIIGARLYRDDGSSIFTPGLGPIQLEPGKAYLAAGSSPADIWNYTQ